MLFRPKSLVCSSNTSESWERIKDFRLNHEGNIDDGPELRIFLKRLVGNGQMTNICRSALFPRRGRYPQTISIFSGTRGDPKISGIIKKNI